MRKPALLLIVCLLVSGCRRDPHLDAYLETLYSQQRGLEDHLNELHHEHKIVQQELEQSEAARKELLRELGRDPDEPLGNRGPGRLGAGASDAGDPDGDGSDESDPGERTPGPRLVPPQIDPGEPFDPSEEAPGAQPGPVTGRERGGPRNAGQRKRSADTRVTHIVLNPYLTQGHDFDGLPGDDGVAVVIEPRNAADQFTAQSGRLSLAVIDPQGEGDEGRLARWDFDADEVRRRLQTGTGDKGIVLHLPWPNRPPQRGELHLFARLELEDGRRFEADRPLFLNLPGQFSHRWTPKSPRPYAEYAREALSDLAGAEVARSDRPPTAALDPLPVLPAGESATGESPASAEGRAPEARLGAPLVPAPQRPVWQPFR